MLSPSIDRPPTPKPTRPQTYAQASLSKEVLAISAQVAQSHRADVARIACLEFMTRRFGNDSSSWTPALRASLAKLRQECQTAWMNERGITDAEVQAAIESLARAETTVRYLDSLPN